MFHAHRSNLSQILFVVQLFIMGREKASLKKDYLKKMVRVFDHYGLQEAKRWLVIACKKW